MYTLKRENTTNLTYQYAAMYTPVCSIQGHALLQIPGTKSCELQVAGSGRGEGGGVWLSDFRRKHATYSVWQMVGGVCSVSNSSNLLERLQVRVVTGTELRQRFYQMKNPDHWHLGRFPPQNPAFASPDISLQLNIWVLIVSCHDQYIYFVVLAALSPPTFRFVIRLIFIESQSKTGYFRVKCAFISQPLNKYQFDHKSESRRWKSD